MMVFLKNILMNKVISDNKEIDYAHAYQRIIDLLDKENRFIDYCSDDVHVKLWLPAMNGVNVTILCDQFFRRQHEKYALIALVTDKGDINCLSVLNIEQQSSGFKIIKQLESDNKVALVMEIRSDMVKTELSIPNNYDNGFVWGNKQNGRPMESHGVPNSRYKCNYILNFSVCGEFNLDTYYIPLNHAEPIMMFSKVFCCK